MVGSGKPIGVLGERREFTQKHSARLRSQNASGRKKHVTFKLLASFTRSL